MKIETLERRSWHAGALRASVLIALSLPLFAQGPPTKTVEFTTGKFEAKLGDSTCTATLGHPGSNLEFYQGNLQVVGVHYSGKNPNCQIRLSLTNVKGPGKYGKGSIFNFSLNWGPTQKAWNFNARQDDCTFTFTKLDESGAIGSVACTGNGPVASATLSATP